MMKEWQNDEGYLIELTLCETRSRIEVKDRAGISLLYREFEYWQRNQAEKEAAALARIAAARPAPENRKSVLGRRCNLIWAPIAACSAA